MKSQGISSDSGCGTAELIAQSLEAEELLSDPVPLVVLDQWEAPKATLETQTELHITRAGDAFGIALWLGKVTEFDRVNAVSADAANSFQARNQPRVLLAWPAMVALTKADNVRLSVRADGLTEECAWQWDSLIRKVEGGSIQGIRYRQNTVTPLPALKHESH